MRLVEHWGAHGDIRQMRAAVIGGVDRVDVARRDAALVLADDGLDGAVHRAEMHRHVRCVGNQRTLGVEHRAREIEPLLDVDRVGGVLQRYPHLLGDRHEQIVEHFEHHRIGLGADRAAARERHDALEHKVVLGRERGAPAGFDHDRLMRLDHDRGAVERVPGRELIAGEHRSVTPGAV